jgi:hypothetical protein
MPISRKGFLIGGAMAVTAGAVAVAVEWPRLNPGAVARQQFVYRGKAVTIDETSTSIVVTINGQPQDHIMKKHPRRERPYYMSHLLPFENFTHPVDLVKALIDAQEDSELFIMSQ